MVAWWRDAACCGLRGRGDGGLRYAQGGGGRRGNAFEMGFLGGLLRQLQGSDREKLAPEVTSPFEFAAVAKMPTPPVHSPVD